MKDKIWLVDIASEFCNATNEKSSWITQM